MSRRTAAFTQADYARAMRAVKQVSAGSVTFRADGSIMFQFGTTHLHQPTDVVERVDPVWTKEF